MEYTPEERNKLIINACKSEKSTNPYVIFNNIASKDFIRIHGPEHHILDGACILTAYHNAGGKISLDASLEKLASYGLLMPGAMCGIWGVCGSVSSVGAALCIIDGTGPLTTDGTWGNHMLFTSSALRKIGVINGPRCCKRDAFISIMEAVKYINKNYPVSLEKPEIKCTYSYLNEQCIGKKCPFNKSK